MNTSTPPVPSCPGSTIVRPGLRPGRTFALAAVSLTVVAGAIGIVAGHLNSAGASQSAASPVTSTVADATNLVVPPPSAPEPTAPVAAVAAADPSPSVATPTTRAAAKAMPAKTPATKAGTTKAGTAKAATAMKAPAPKPAPAATKAAPVAGEPTTTTTTTTTAPRVKATSDTVSFRGDGLGIVSLGANADNAVSVLINAYGTPDWDSDWYRDDVEGTSVRMMTFGSLTTYFAEVNGERQMVGAYYYLSDPSVQAQVLPALTTSFGWASGTTRRVALRDAFPAGTATTVDPSSTSTICADDHGGRLCGSFYDAYSPDRADYSVPSPDAELHSVLVGRMFGGHCGM